MAELAEFGVPAPGRIPTLYPLSASLVGRPDIVQVAHAKTSGEAEWALVVGEDDLLLTAACDHTDRALEVHGVAWSKQSAPDLLGDVAWPLGRIERELDQFTLKAWVRHGDTDELIQDGTAGQLLPPSYWLKELGDRLVPGTVLLSGTIPMIAGVDQFADAWRVELTHHRVLPAGSCTRSSSSHRPGTDVKEQKEFFARCRPVDRRRAGVSRKRCSATMPRTAR